MDMKYRYENFGGIIAGEKPPFLAFVDRLYMQELGFPDSERWQDSDQEIGLLSAPVEVHIAVTNRCRAGCPHCYMDAGAGDAGELSLEDFQKALGGLADLGVFHVALGGGEALERPELFEIAAYARKVGLVPNLTISGRLLDEAIARRMKIFGQVNVSVDGIGKNYGVFRGQDMFTTADRALDLLVRAGVPTGINCVLGRRNYHELPALFDYAGQKGLNEIELLRFKPAGRAMKTYRREKMTFEQNIELAPRLADLSTETGVTAKIDCSFVPMFCYHRPPPEALTAMATYGCEAGNVLLGIKSNGLVAGCSFLASMGLSVFDFKGNFRDQQYFSDLTNWLNKAPRPCRTCDYLTICKGGCRAVALAESGTLNALDPECPFVVEWKTRR
jgi:radical SAM protein with 4Fe4S-binding SPASM domain